MSTLPEVIQAVYVVHGDEGAWPPEEDVIEAVRSLVAKALDAEEERWRKPASWPAHKAIDNLRANLLGETS